MAVVLDRDDGAAVGPGEAVGEDAAVAVVGEGRVIDGVEGREQGLVGGWRGDGGRGGVDDEVEGGGGVGDVVGFAPLEGTFGGVVVSGFGDEGGGRRGSIRRPEDVVKVAGRARRKKGGRPTLILWR